MALIHWEAPEKLTTLRRDMDRLLEDFLVKRIIILGRVLLRKKPDSLEMHGGIPQILNIL